MKILMFSDYFPPEIGSASFLFYELARNLVRKGDKVSVVTGMPRYNINMNELDHRYKRRVFLKEKLDGIEIFRIRTFNLSRKNNILRGLDQFLSTFLYFTRAFFISDYDYILIYSPPLPLGLNGYFLKILKGKKTVVNVQDLFPQTAIDLGVLKNKFLIRMLTALEKFVYLKNDFITVHSPGNKKHVIRITGEKIPTVVIPNWVNTEEISPGLKDNEFSRKYNLLDKFVISYAGTLGESQDLDIVLDAAKAFSFYKDIIFIIVGDGRKKLEIEQRIKTEKIDNVVITPIQPKEKYPLVLHSSDIGLVTLRSEVKTPVVPSKILSIMAAGLPIVASLPLSGDAPYIISESRAGFCVDAGDVEGFVRAIEQIYKNSFLRRKFGENGRRFIEDKYSLDICSAMYKEVLSSI